MSKILLVLLLLTSPALASRVVYDRQTGGFRYVQDQYFNNPSDYYDQYDQQQALQQAKRDERLASQLYQIQQEIRMQGERNTTNPCYYTGTCR